MSRQIQKVFEGLESPKDVFGGSLLTSNPKTARPLDSKLPTHLVLRSQRSFMRRPAYFAKVNGIVKKACKKHGVRLYEYANVGNHLHLLIKIRNRPSWAAFIRELTGRIAQLTKAKWEFRPYTRIVRGWRMAYRRVKNYVKLNFFEAEGTLSIDEASALRELRRTYG